MSKKLYMLKGLDCANCAAKIQDDIEKLNEVESAELVFATQKLSVKIGSSIPDSVITEKINKIVADLEPDVEVFELGTQKNDTEHDHSHGSSRTELVKLVASGVFFAAGMLLKLPLWAEFLTFGVSYLIAGAGTLSRAAKNITRGQIFDENFLMSISTLGAFAIKEYPEAAAVMLFFKIGELLEDMAVNKSRRSIKSLMDIRPDHANLKKNESVIQVSPEEVNVGDIIIVKPGERVPLDGKILAGKSSADTSALTGESVPKTLHPGDTVLSGFINRDGLLTIEVEKTFENSTVSKILDLVENATAKKAQTENFITKFARYYTPIVVAAALLVAIIPPLLTGSMEFSKWINRALIFLVISCPCALVISVPLSFFGGIGGASKRGILVKGSNYLEALNNVNAVVFDKTGTLTKGVFKVSEIFPNAGYSRGEVLEFAAFAEAQSNHPIARSIIEAYGKNIDTTKIQSYQEIPGHGIKALIDGKEIFAGNDKLMNSLNSAELHLSEVHEGTIVHVAVNGSYAGYIAISDEVREDSAQTISQLKELGDMRIAMLTGDNEDSAKAVATKLKIDEFYSGLLPHQKVEKLEKIKNSSDKPKLMFVGDGINDAPVLAMSDIGVAMGGLGSDAAIEAADIVLMTDEPFKIVEAIKVAKKTRSIVWQNIIFALGVKVLVMALGTIGIATMWEAVFADVGVTLIAVFNSLRTMKK